MQQNRSFVLFELNEVPMRVIEHYAEKNPGSAFSKLLSRGGRWHTRTPDEGHLSPWITWPTLHRGVPSRDHGIAALGQDVEAIDQKYPPVWELLAKAGRRIGVFGSLHSYPLPREVRRYTFYVPDTFAAGPETYPPELSAFQRFNLSMVDRSGRNVSNELPLKDGLKFLLQAVPAGIRPATVAKIIKQVGSERIWAHRTVRRRTVQALLAFDLFLAQIKAKRPDGAFFFTNHVASSMHRYWPAAFRSDYKRTDWNDDWIRRFAGEVDYAMDEADQMLKDLVVFADRNPDYVILVAGSMGQAAVDDPGRRIRTEVLLRDMAQFLCALGLTGDWERRRTMEPTYTVSFREERSVDQFMGAAAETKIAGLPLNHRRLDSHSVEFVLGMPNVPDADVTVTVGNVGYAPAQVGIANVPIEDEVGAAAYHVPQGMLLSYDPRGQPYVCDEVLTTQIAPTLLALQGVEAPPYMQPPLCEVLGVQHECV